MVQSLNFPERFSLVAEVAERGGTHEAARARSAVLAIASPSFAQVEYPPTKTVDASDTYFGVTYKDPYRWLEDLKDQAVQGWFKSQATVTDDLLARIPARDALADEWLKLDRLQPAKYNAITFENGRVFYKKTLGGENVGKLYYRDGWRGAEKLLFDPSTFKPRGAKEGDVTTIQGMAASPDGKIRRARILGSGRGVSRRSRSSTSTSGSSCPRAGIPRTVRSAGRWIRSRCSTTWARSHDIKSPEIELNRKTKIHRLGTPVAATSTSSRTKPIPTSESRPRNSRRRSSTSPIPTT